MSSVFIGGWSHGTFGLALTQIPDAQKESWVQHKPHGLCKLSGHTEPLPTNQGTVGTLPKSKFLDPTSG